MHETLNVVYMTYLKLTYIEQTQGIIDLLCHGHALLISNVAWDWIKHSTSYQSTFTWKLDLGQRLIYDMDK